ncbi:hypothetical protein [Fibrella aquatilis]|uniref:Uncharacterized protein n=1 Tax=Fibrella aquatilis TaxID=2817059 RepID=A0A939G8V4_9BACT|nr:hypothetical protein [Fibrella aquatilis]MBO0934587.1 hypothetical protein [Fibrella aquatilis]
MKKFKNTYGQAYATADTEKKLLFRATLITAGKRDQIDYMGRFQDTWQFATVLGLVPDAIATAAREHLIDSNDNALSRLQTLKMA